MLVCTAEDKRSQVTSSFGGIGFAVLCTFALLSGGEADWLLLSAFLGMGVLRAVKLVDGLTKKRLGTLIWAAEGMWLVAFAFASVARHFVAKESNSPLIYWIIVVVMIVAGLSLLVRRFRFNASPS